jgi:hypothetical protein
MTSRNPQHRRDDIHRRISAVDAGGPCYVLGCPKLATAAERSGLNRKYCRAHVEHFRRHGSYSKTSYSARDLSPRRVDAFAWLDINRHHADVREAIGAVRTLYWRGGQPEEAFRLAGKPPERRALICWARLRAKGVDPLHALAAWLAVSLCHRADPQPERKIEFRWVQAGKVLHRMSGGSHKRWEHAGTTAATKLHKYPASRGRVLRHLGEQLASAAKPLEHHLSTITACMASTARLPRVKRRTAR